MSSIKTTQIDGDVSVGRNVSMGGKARIAGSVTIGHNLKVNGWIDAPNVKNTNKGLFTALEKLETAFPTPKDGWFAGVGTSTPFSAYVAENGKWVATGGTIDIDIEILANTIAGYVAIGSVDNLPAEPTAEQQQKGYLLNTTLYVYVGEGGDTLDGKYQSAQLKGDPGEKGSKGDSGVDLGEVVLVNDLTTGGEDSALSAEMGKVLNENLGKITGNVQGTFTWVDRRKINTNGTVDLTNNVHSTEPFMVKAGSTIHATGSGTGFAVISRYDKATSKYTALAIMDTSEVQEYVIKAEEDMMVAISGLSTGDGAVQARVLHAGTIYKDVMMPYDVKLYTKEEIPASMSRKPIKMNVGDIVCVVNPLNNNDIVRSVDANGTAIRTLWRPTTAHGYTMFKYEKTPYDGVNYIDVYIASGDSPFSYAYILRRKPLINVMSSGIYAPEYDTYDNPDGEVTANGQYISRDGSIITESTVRHRIFKIANNGYKSVYAKTTSVGGTGYCIAFYNGEPSAETFLPIYSKAFWEHESEYNSGPYEYTAIVPDDAVYIAICMRLDKGNNDLRLYKDTIIPQVNDIRDTFEACYSEHLLPMAYQHNTPEYLESGHFANYKKVDFKCIFYTDLHSCHDNLNRIMMLGDYLYDKGVLDCIIAGGDNLQDGAESYDWFNHTLSQSKVDNLVAVGNHDASTRWHATKQSAYENNIAPMLSRVENVVVPDDSASAYRLYYYKDYNNVRVIVLFTPVTGDTAFADDAQLTWLQTVLSDAKTNNKHVLIVNHHYYNTAYEWNYASLGEFWESKPNTFLTPYGKVGSSFGTEFVFPTDFLLAVKAFEDAGGKFICWLSGHGHYDNFFDVTDHSTYGYQPMFNSASCAHKHSANEFVKKKGEKSMDLFNYICIDTTNTTIDILRIGCNIDVFGRSRKVLTYNYGAHCIMANY